MVNNINTYINMHKIMNTHINTHINNINTHNLYLRWRAARPRRDERAGAAGTAAGRGRADGAAGTAEGPGAASSRRGEQPPRRAGGREPEWGGGVLRAHDRGKGPTWGGRGSGQTARRQAEKGAAAGREEEESVREEKGERRTVGNFIF
jgi:hypothetical protein